ncbi:ABC transporter ATP-binding protein [Azospirillum sp. A39]|uniref:ABC transporter ATP-binding protein n=1 Tax=Azospirillum sp. A39 TaxID=3462279 RepID=UPI0040451C52
MLRDLRLEVPRHQVVALVGPSGCGKTTLLNLVAGLDDRFDGAIERPSGRLAVVFQNPRLLPWRTVAQNLALAMPAGTPDLDGRIDALLAAVGLDGQRDVFPNHLSLGMQRRVAVARAFLVEPELLLLDEPFVSLDAATAARLRGLLRDLLARHPATVLLVTHDLREAIALADRLVVLGGSPATVVRDVPVALPERSPAAVEAFYREVSGAV